MNNKRTNYFINKDFQTRFIIRFCLLVVFSGLLTMGILYFLGKGSTTVSIINSQVVVRSTADFLLPILIQIFLIVMVVVGFATIGVTLLFSHKISGPLYSFKKTLKSLKEGDFSKDIHIRSYDQLQDLADDFNSMIKVVRDQVNTAKFNIAKLKDKNCRVSDQDIDELDRNIKFFKT